MTTVGLPADIPTTRRRVRRIVRKLDPWTVLKVAIIFTGIAGLAFVLLSIVGWTIFNQTDIPETINRQAESVRLIEPGESWLESGDQYFRGVVFLTVSWMIMVTGLFTLGAILYNLIAEIVGGVEFTVMEDVPIDLAQQEAEAAAEPKGNSA